jgi:acetyl-CoA carboxylase biotin carboxylase subunit
MAIKKILIANRGEIALRILRAAHEMGIETVAVHSTADADAMHVRLATHAVCIGPPAAKDSYLNVAAIISAAEITGADAIHPGYGFLSENARFAEIVEAHGLIWIGPKPEHIRTMGDKVSRPRRRLAIWAAAGARLARRGQRFRRGARDCRGNRLSGDHQGGQRRRRARHEGVQRTRRARNADAAGGQRGEGRFGDATVYIEKYLGNPRHIEFQVFGDGKGKPSIWANATARFSAATRRCWKKRPRRSSAEERARMGGIVSKAMADMGYRGAGTIEFLWENGEFYFIEMNTRLQVEHPVTEAITGVDLVREQIRIADGQPLSVKQEDIEFRGHAIECRINAEDPWTFAPSPGLVENYHVGRPACARR